MHNLADTISKIAVADTVSYEKLSIVPLVRQDFFELDYITLDEATKAGAVTITETSAEGSVPELLFSNTADQAVLLLDGEELTGAKQNRIVNLTILAPANSKFNIPVSCVEAGRWHHDTNEFAVADRAMFSLGRARKSEDISISLMRNGTRSSRQGEVWEDISAKATRMDCTSDTDAMASMFESHQAVLNAYVSALLPVPNQVGAIFQISGTIVGIELFDHSTTMKRLMPKLVRSYALDSLDTPDQSEETQQTTDGSLDQLSQAKLRSFAAVGEGSDLRFDDKHFTGGALEARGRIVHLCAFPKRPQTQQANGSMSGLARASIRRRAYR
jgi:hypothetical protein